MLGGCSDYYNLSMFPILLSNASALPPLLPTTITATTITTTHLSTLPFELMIHDSAHFNAWRSLGWVYEKLYDRRYL
ncbi:hypothetical protein POX_g08853 [Penicillium oxalicum]|uniref:Uncharacterized protein n=1 Tax=Penicillium oxalicum (strain 114-2 / CGMCC 5302) TaxID=933388 RepID=S8ALX4_PENO1|nr:hypothetical protein POX_g08853 [Penicillium oxalicum]EPS26848.1 hypothetical protein PDE_01787 [Penicillium oxalicum 114-2]KAI2786467.1 hypothetical protein POX_g08853 [Penicillium oxalicum]